MGNKFLILAQSTDLSSVPAEVLKYVLIVIVSIILITAAVYMAFFSGRRLVQARLDDDPPITVRKAPKRYNHDAIEQRFTNVEKRVDASEAEIDSLWNTMRAEDKQTRDEHAKSLGRIQRSLGRIEGRMGIPPESEE